MEQKVSVTVKYNMPLLRARIRTMAQLEGDAVEFE